MSRIRRQLTLCSVTAVAVAPLTACGENYDPCWLDADTAASLFSVTSIHQALNTEEATARTSGYTPIGEAEALGDTGCAYELSPESLGPDISVVLHRVPMKDWEEQVEADLARPFDEYLLEAEEDSDPRVFVEEWRDVSIVYSYDTARMILDEHLWWARYTSDSSMRGDRGSDAEPLMRYVAGSRGGTDIAEYEAWLEDEAAQMAAEAEAAAAEQAEQDYSVGHAAGLEDGQYEAIHGHPPQHYHRGLADRSDDWVRGFEEGKAEALAAGPPPGSLGEGEWAVDWEDEYAELFDNTQGPFDSIDPDQEEIPEDLWSDGYFMGFEDGFYDAEDFGDWMPTQSLYEPYGLDAGESAVYREGYSEGYREGFIQGWRESGKPESDLPVEAR